MENRKEGSDLGVAPETVAGLSEAPLRSGPSDQASPIPNADELCGCCGREPYRLLRFPDVEAYTGSGEKWIPMCMDAYHQHLENADDVNRHEMEHFGGAYGLVTWEERDAKATTPNT